MTTLPEGAYVEESGAWVLFLVAVDGQLQGELKNNNFTCDVAGQFTSPQLHLAWKSVFSWTNDEEAGDGFLEVQENGERLIGQFTIFGETRQWSLHLAVTDREEPQDAPSQASSAQGQSASQANTARRQFIKILNDSLDISNPKPHNPPASVRPSPRPSASAPPSPRPASHSTDERPAKQHLQDLRTRPIHVWGRVGNVGRR